MLSSSTFQRQSEIVEFDFHITHINNKFSPQFNVKYLRVDGGGEFINSATQNFLDSKGIELAQTVRKSSQMNPYAERIIRTLTETARSFMNQSGCPARFWREAVNYAAYVRNRCPSRGIQNATPHQLWNGTVPDLSRLRTFGCLAFAILEKDERGKYNDNAQTCMHKGYAKNGYLLYNPSYEQVNRPPLRAFRRKHISLHSS